MAPSSNGSVLAIGLSVIVYCVTVSLIPLYTKVTFSGGLGVPKFKYPITAAWLQLGLASILLIITAIAMRPLGLSPDSWLLGPHFWFKMTYVLPPGLAFGLMYSVKNWALTEVSSGTFVLFGATDLIWILVLARIINKEKMGILELLAVLVCIIGIILVVVHKTKGGLDAVGFEAIFSNMLGPFIGALTVTTLRRGVVGLFDKSNRLHGSTTKIEFTAFKITIAAVAAFISSMIFENGVIHITNTKEKLPDAWWVYLAHYPAKGTLLVCATGILTYVFHINFTWLTYMTSATAMGLMQEVKVLPQYGFNAIFTALGVKGMKVDTALMNITGATLGLLGSVLYAGASHISHEKGKLLLGRGGFQWVKGHEDKVGLVTNESTISERISLENVPETAAKSS